jgi:hypothetical protein
MQDGRRILSGRYEEEKFLASAGNETSATQTAACHCTE